MSINAHVSTVICQCSSKLNLPRLEVVLSVNVDSSLFCEVTCIAYAYTLLSVTPVAVLTSMKPNFRT